MPNLPNQERPNIPFLSRTILVMCNPNDPEDDSFDDDEASVVSSFTLDDDREEIMKIKKLISKQTTNAAIWRTMVIFVVRLLLQRMGFSLTRL